MELVVAIAVIAGLLVLLVWPAARVWQRSRSPRDQEQVTDTEPIPPVDPDEPLPGSREHRRRQGMP